FFFPVATHKSSGVEFEPPKTGIAFDTWEPAST
ncbi:hypothetical protein MNBD_ALPHA09-1614, partial [hydrothermal vent metagenome]